MEPTKFRYPLIATLEKPRMQYVWLILITMLAAALRLYKLGAWSFWIDEIYTINRAQIHFSDPIHVLQNLPSTLWLPFSVILTNISLSLFGVNEWSARLASALLGIVTLPVLYFITRQIFGIGIALFFILLLAMSPWHLFWSQNARFYTAIMLLYALAAFFLYLGLELDRPAYLLGFYVLFYFAISERLIAAFFLPSIPAYFILLKVLRFELPPGFNKRNLLLLLIPFILMLAYELIRFTVSGSSITTYFISDFGEKQVEDPIRLLLAIFYNIGFPVVTTGSLAGVYLLMQKQRIGLFLIVCATVPIVLLTLANPLFFTKDRYVFVTLTFWLFLSAVAIQRLLSWAEGSQKWLALGLLAVLLSDAIASDILYFHVNNGNRRDWRAAFHLIRANAQIDDRVVAWWPEFGPFYLDRPIIPYKDITSQIVEESGNRYWFVVDSETVWGNIPLRDWLETHAQLIDVLYLRLPEDDFSLKIYLYDPAQFIPDG